MERMHLLALASFLALSGCRDTGSGVNIVDDEDLVAALSADAVLVTLGTPIRFDAGDSTDTAGTAARFSDTSIDGFTWNFGDGPDEASDLFYLDHEFTEAGTYTVGVTVTQGEELASATLDVEVRFPPPALLGPDAGADEVAVIGEWITLQGRGFREGNLPDVSFEGVEAPNVAFLSEYEIAVQVPPTAPSGNADLVVDFPYEDDADDVFLIWVTRYGLATDAWRGRVSIIEFGSGDEAAPLSQSIELDEAAVVAMSGDGAFALVGDARYAANLAPRIVVADMTADYQPVVVAELENVGVGPLHGIAIAKDVPIAAITDVGGFSLVDLSDPANPVAIGDREAFSFGDLAPTAVALNADATKLALLSTFNDRVRFYEINSTGVVYSQDWVAVGEGAQDMVVHPETGFLVVMGGGGEGAIPPDFDLGNTTLAVLDWNGFEPENVHGPGVYMGTSAAPVPIDLAVGPSGTAYVTTFDQNTGGLLGALGDIGNNPGDLSAWVDLVDGITNLSLGAVQPLDGTLDGTLVEREPLFAPFGFQGGVGVRFDERLYVSTVVGLGTTLEVFNGDDILYLSLDMDYGIAIGNLVTGNVQTFPLYNEAIVEYDDFVLNYDLGPVTGLLLPPWALGDVAIQP
ncbi:MAG: PKD domain-containing protein [Deltaproteobacteria bacterium]|nr:PKD domain-containing protein [Deltaproteobacteria bacterium]